MHVNFGLLPPLEPHIRNKRARHAALAERGAAALREWVLDFGDELELPLVTDAVSRIGALR
jgi:hypothetical protein